MRNDVGTKGSQLGGPLAGIWATERGVPPFGPFRASLLADLGAEVIKVEAPHKDTRMRTVGQFLMDDKSLGRPSTARNKKGTALNLRDPEGEELQRQLVRQSDVFVANFPPGVFEESGLGYEVLRELNPCLVFARVPGMDRPARTEKNAALPPHPKPLRGCAIRPAFQTALPVGWISAWVILWLAADADRDLSSWVCAVHPLPG